MNPESCIMPLIDYKITRAVKLELEFLRSGCFYVAKARRFW